MRITQEQFRKDYGGDLEKLTAQSARKKYVYDEFKLQCRVAEYLQTEYPDALFISNPINLKLTKVQRGMMAAINKKGFKCPDLLIFQIKISWSPCDPHYYGLYMELKKETPYRLDGALKSDKHLQAQWQSILKLRKRGFHADFYWTFDQAKERIDWYFGNED